MKENNQPQNILEQCRKIDKGYIYDYLDHTTI